MSWNKDGDIQAKAKGIQTKAKSFQTKAKGIQTKAERQYRKWYMILIVFMYIYAAFLVIFKLIFSYSTN